MEIKIGDVYKVSDSDEKLLVMVTRNAYERVDGKVEVVTILNLSDIRTGFHLAGFTHYIARESLHIKVNLEELLSDQFNPVMAENATTETAYVTVSEEAKAKLIEEHGLSEADFESEGE